MWTDDKIMSNRTQAHNDADKRYEQKIKRLVIKFNQANDDDITRLAFLESQNDKTAFIKSLIDQAIVDQKNNSKNKG